MADFFAVRDSIKAQIEENLPEIKKIYYAEELDDVKEKSQIAPAIHLLYGGYAPAQAERIRVDITITQTWVVVLVLKQARNDFAGGEILDKLIQALHGFKPHAEAKALELAQTPFTPSYRPGVAYYPLAFNTLIINRKGA